MKKTVFDRSKIKETFFKYVDLTEAKFIGADLEGTTFHSCDLTKADFTDAQNVQIDPFNNKLKKCKLPLTEAMHLLRYFDIDIL